MLYSFLAKNNKIYKSARKNLIINHVLSMLDNTLFLEHLLKVVRYKKENNELENMPDSVLSSANFINLSLNSSFYIIAHILKELSQANIEFFGKGFFVCLKK